MSTEAVAAAEAMGSVITQSVTPEVLQLEERLSVIEAHVASLRSGGVAAEAPPADRAAAGIAPAARISPAAIEVRIVSDS